LAETDWLELWTQVVTSTRHRSETEKTFDGRKHFRRDSAFRPDPLLDYVLGHLRRDQTFLDIGAGTGRWTIPAARIVRQATAIEPSDSMQEMLRENIEQAGLDNIRVIQARWETAEVEKHDIVACTHAIYETPDFAAFIRKMEASAAERCYLVMRLPPYDGIIGRLSCTINGHPYDSPNAMLAYNALYSMGIYPNVLVEHSMHHWTDSNLEAAFSRAKRHLNLESSGEYDDLVRSTLEQRLTFTDDTYTWPDGMRSVLLWWDTKNSNS
jgi:SAM-dependent methyltransferase